MNKFAFYVSVCIGFFLVSCGDDSSSVTIPSGEVSLSTLLDSRDGQTYKTVAIGTQTWMAQNLNFETANSYCYDDDPFNCIKYGRYYTWAAAMDSVGMWTANGKDCGYGKTCSPTLPVRGVCPEGWHLPTFGEWNVLFSAVGGQPTAGKMLKSTSGWNCSDNGRHVRISGNGTDDYSFSALPVGLDIVGCYAYFWSSDEGGSGHAYDVDLCYGNDYAEQGLSYKFYRIPVRCVKD
ncbi:hypothetical protein B7982_04270 [Fibrobacter sp. UWB2]|nr:hypothetical protein B7982_04270 [Fibrobacter sp. UWB2]